MTVHDARSGWQQWGTAVRSEIRIVGALVRREMRAHFGDTRLGYLWAFFEPVLHLVLFLLLFTVVFKRSSPLGNSTGLFLLTGIVPYFLFQKTATYVSGSIGANRSLIELPPVQPHNVILARVVLQSVTFLLVSFVMFLALLVGGIADAVPYDPLAVMAACALAICFGLGVGMINIVLLSYFHTWMTIYGMFTFPVWILSGVWFVPEQVPQPFRTYMLYNPIMHIVMWFRSGFYQHFKAVSLDIPYAVGVSVLTLAVGLAAMRVARQKVLERQ